MTDLLRASISLLVQSVCEAEEEEEERGGLLRDVHDYPHLVSPWDCSTSPPLAPLPPTLNCS